MHPLVSIALWFDRGGHYLWYGPLHYQALIILAWSGIAVLTTYFYYLLGAAGTWEKVLSALATDATLAVAASVTSMCGAFTVAAGVQAAPPERADSRAGSGTPVQADDDAGAVEYESTAAAAPSAGSPLLQSSRKRKQHRSSPSSGTSSTSVALRRHVNSGRHGPFPLLATSGRSMTTVTMVANAGRHGCWGASTPTLLLVLWISTTAVSIGCDMITFTEISPGEGKDTPAAWTAFVVADIFDDVSTCGSYIYLAMIAWALRTRARRLIVCVEEGAADDRSSAESDKRGSMSSREALEAYLGLHDATLAASKAASWLPFALIVIGVIENASMIQTLFQEGGDSGDDGSTTADIFCMVRLYIVISGLVIAFLFVAGRFAETAEEIALAATHRAAQAAQAIETLDESESDGGEFDRRRSILERELMGWDRLSQACRAQPLVLRSGGLKLTGEVAGSVSLALVTLGLAIIGIRLPEM